MKTWPSRILAVLLLVIGLAVTGGGAMLVSLGGSPYYLVGGIAVALAGFWTWRSDARAGWLYAGFIAVTALWALWEVGLDGFGQIAFVRDQILTCMFMFRRGKIAAWSPCGIRFGPVELTGGPDTPQALEKLGALLRATTK